MTLIQPKKKICKGSALTKDSACNKPDKYIFRIGLCESCFKNWLLSTPDGYEYLSKVRLKCHKINKVQEKKNTQEKKKELMSVDEYRAKVVQPIINEIARLIDYGQPCIATGNFGKISGGHYYSTGSNRTLTLNLHNIHNQCFHSNNWKGGDNIKYRAGLIRIYGQEYADFVESLKSTPAKHLSKSDLYEIKRIACEIRHDLKKDVKTYSQKERIELRTQFNEMLNLNK